MSSAEVRLLEKAVREGDVATVRARLADALAPTPEGKDSPLGLAAMFGQLEVARVLLDAGAPLDHRGAYGRSPLHYAARAGAAMTSLLLERGADLRARNDGDEDVLADLITDEKADAEVARRLITAGLDLAARPTKTYAGRSHLMWACFCGRLPLVEVLLAAGVDPNERAPDGRTAFEHTLSGLGDKPRLVAALVRGGLAPDATARLHGTTALQVLCRAGDVEHVRLLLERGADPNLRLNGTPLTAAEESGNPALRDLLLERGARPEPPALVTSPERDAVEAAARAEPTHASTRLAWARVLLAAGARAAAVHELDAAERLGAHEPSLRAALELENPPGTRWRLTVAAREEVAPFLDDSRFPNATAHSGARSLPLSVVLGPPCTLCDADGTRVCSQCDGSGTRQSLFSDHEYDCPTREDCSTCCATGFVLDTAHLGDGACPHPARVKEFEGEVTLSRCSHCGLPTVRTHQLETTACGVCGRFACVCAR